jgi:GlpG protein
MREIGILAHENEARRFSNFLKSQGIESSFDVSFEPRTGQMSYQIWVQEEDRLEEAAKIFDEFVKAPSDPKFDAPEPAAKETPEVIEQTEEDKPTHHFSAFVSYFAIVLCAFIFFISYLQKLEQKEQDALTPIEMIGMYDLPASSNYWQGAYGWVLAKIKGESTASVEGPLFGKIREGQFWRLFTPCLLHKDLLHILFNMLWVWYLGRPIEQRIGPSRMILFTLIAGIGSNTCQYLMGGPFFIGYSGIVTALAGFIWMREKIAPWEGYPLNRSTILFLLFFILAILGLQIVSFCLQIFTSYTFAPNIANTAHIAGAVIGALLAKLHFFAQRVKR